MIHLLTKDQAAQLRDLRLMSLQTDPDSFISTFDFEKEYSVEYFSQKIIYKTYFPTFGYHGFFRNNQLVSYVLLDKQVYPKSLHQAYIYELYVHPDFRGKGFATQLLKHIVRLARTEGLEQLLLHVHEKNILAQTIYTKMGFKEIARLERTIKVQHESGARYEDELVFRLDLLNN